MNAPQSYDAVAESRPRIRRDVLFTETPEGVLFHSANSGFRLKGVSAYRFSSLIVPHLNGDRRVADICKGLTHSQRSMVAMLVRSLYARGLARDVPYRDNAVLPGLTSQVARRFAAQIGYIDHHVDGAEERFGRFRTTRVAVVGGDLIARWCAMSLVRNGAATVGVQTGLDRHQRAFQEVRAEARSLSESGCATEI